MYGGETSPSSLPVTALQNFADSLLSVEFMIRYPTLPIGVFLSSGVTLFFSIVSLYQKKARKNSETAIAITASAFGVFIGMALVIGLMYNEAIADQVRTELTHLPDTHEIKMYGGIAFMVNDKMCAYVGGSKADNIMVRIGADVYEGALKRKGPRPTIIKDRPIKGYIDLDSEGRKDLREWVELALRFNEELVSEKK